MVWINAMIQGVMLGGLRALCAAGPSLMFGVLRFIIIAHRDFIVLGAHAIHFFLVSLGLPAAMGVVPVVLLLAAAGHLNQRDLRNRVLGQCILLPILVTFGMSIILGVAQAIGAQVDAGYQILAVHLACLVILIVSPRGLMPKMA
ncbi:hypothetical protein [Mesobacterium pallidum]|uniref:hypothetical protein n=1 Tax=Mesobacterium pallidum TaxID=2872037 RepID=UPI001EE32BF3|nr:hypothetical protein [Mesobacterium pallidum]